MAKKTGKKPKKTIVSLEIHESLLKLCEIAFFKHKPTVRLVSKKIPSQKNDDISREIAGLFAALGISRKRVLLNIPRHHVMAKFLRLPSTQEDEIRKMVGVESQKHTPYASEEIITGFRITEKRKDGYSNILMAVVHKNTVGRYLSIAKNAGLTVEKIALSSESLFKWHELVEKNLIKQNTPGVVLVNADSEYIDIDFIKNRNLVSARAFSYGGREPADNKKAAEEIRKTIAYQKGRRLIPDRILLSGAGGRIKELEPVLKDELEAPIEIIPQAKGLELDKSMRADTEGVSFIELIGLAFKKDAIQINLLPQTLIDENDFFHLRRRFRKTLILLVCLGLVCVGIFVKKIFDKSRLLSMLNRKIEIMQPQITRIKKMQGDLKLIREEIQKKPLAIDILAEVYETTPQNIFLSALNYKSNRFLILKGNAPSLNEIIKFVNTLEKSNYFANVKIKYTAKKTGRDKQVTEFQIVCVLSKVS